MKSGTSFKLADTITARYFKRITDIAIDHPTYLDIWNFLADNQLVEGEVTHGMSNEVEVKLFVKSEYHSTIKYGADMLDSDGDILYDKLVKMLVRHVMDKKLVK